MCGWVDYKMTVVSANHVSLIRCRKALEKAFDNKDWERVRQWDLRLGNCLNTAFDDPYRDTDSLVEELEKVLSLYAKIVSAVPAEADSVAMKSLLAFNSIPVSD